MHLHPHPFNHSDRADICAVVNCSARNFGTGLISSSAATKALKPRRDTPPSITPTLNAHGGVSMPHATTSLPGICRLLPPHKMLHKESKPLGTRHV